MMRIIDIADWLLKRAMIFMMMPAATRAASAAHAHSLRLRASAAEVADG